jgi:hypothetical protein
MTEKEDEMRLTTFPALALLLALASVLGACDDGGEGAATDADSDADTDADSDADSDSDSDTGPDCAEEDRWWIWDLSVMPPQDAQICATVRGTGENVYVLVADDAWGASVDEAVVDDLIAAWDEGTPSDPEVGIFGQVTALFGDPPDAFDGDPRIYLFLYEMEGYMGYTFDGYFKVDDQLAGPTSNRHEMLHINSLSGGGPDSDYMLSVQAHEFQHLIHWGHDPDEEAWINESMSELAMVRTGFGSDEAWMDAWLNDPAAPLMSNGPDYDYGIFLLFGTYLWERFGDAFIGTLVADPDNGVAGLDNILLPMSSVQDFAEVLGDLALAIAVNDPDLPGGKFGFEAIDAGEPDSTSFSSTDAASATVVANGGFAFFSSDEGADDLTLRLTAGTIDELEVRAAFTGPAGSELVLTALEGAVTEVALGAWPAGATLWIAAANPGGAAVSLEASLF